MMIGDKNHYVNTQPVKTVLLVISFGPL